MKTIKAQHDEAMKIFEEELDKLGWVVKPHGHFNSKGEPQCACRAGEEYKVEKKNILSFLTSRYLITAENIVSDIKSEIERVEGMKLVENPNKIIPADIGSHNIGYNQALSDYLLHLQEKLSAAERDLESIKL